MLPDKKVWLMEDVNPWEYETVNGEKRLKDWAQAELEARIAKPAPEDVTTEEQLAVRRQMSRDLRHIQLTPEDVKKAEELFLEGMWRAKAQAAGLILPE